MLLVVMLFGMATALLVYGMVDTNSLALRRDKDTAAALAEAKQALIGRAVVDGNRPGSLPCPDFDDGTINAINVPNDGIADVMAGSECPSYVGRLPWRTLGLPDLRDSDGEGLWYALSNNFRDHASAEPINSDTKGNRTVYRESTAVTLTSAAVAVIFAPGTTLAGQIRDGTAALCPTTGTTIASSLCATNYLEATGGANNATVAGPYITAERSATFNDRLLVITTAELMPVVEKRVASEMFRLLTDPITGYRATSVCACYPWASNNFDDDSVTGRTRGMAPIEDALPEVWGSGGIPSVPSWINNNEWGKMFYYAVAPSQTATPTAGTLTVDGASKNLVLITTGPAGASRPSTNLPDYLEDSENRNNDDIFVTPSSTTYARDRLYTLP